MAASSSRTPSLTPSSTGTFSPFHLAQPDHFYGADSSNFPPSSHSDGSIWLSPDDDPLARRGIPVFKPTMEEFKDFEGYMTRVESWGAKSGIIKIIPPQEWTATLPSVKEPLKQVKIKSPIEQHMLGRGGLFRQENVEKRKFMSVREWAELCQKDDFRAPGVAEVGLHARSMIIPNKPKRGKNNAGAGSKRSSTEMVHGTDAVSIKQELDDDLQVTSLSEPAEYQSLPSPSPSLVAANLEAEAPSVSTKRRPKRQGKTREAREAGLAERALRDSQFLDTFDPCQDWLPPNTKATDYTPEFCHSLERQYWRNCGLAKPAWYGADSQGSLFTDETEHWNVAHLDSTLSRLLPASDQGLPGVNTPYLYFGMWRATFAWHVEDMDLFSINYIHFGAPKFWYAVPQGRAAALEQTMRGFFPKDTSQCPQFLRHKSFLASPTLLAQSACRPNHLVQHAGEIVVTFPRGYHAGFNLGFNCAESVNFALDSWLDVGKRAKVCECVSDSVRIDVNQLLLDRALEAATTPSLKEKLKNSPGKRKSVSASGPKAKRIKTEPNLPSLGGHTVSTAQLIAKKPHVTLKLGPKPLEAETYPCCLCTSMSREGLLRVHDPPVQRREAIEAAHYPKEWKAHEFCANVIPETWVDEMDSVDGLTKEKFVCGVDGIVKDRWNLKCTACTKTRDKVHGAPIQCTKGKCPKAFHVSCAREGSRHGIVFTVVKNVEKEVVLVDPSLDSTTFTLASAASSTPLLAPPTNTMDVNVDSGPQPDVLKVISKIEVQVLCAQHNPALAAVKKANKQDRIRNDLLALPSMARIKIRVSAGVFEVSLIRVIEDTGSVEVLWDRGLKREFKWGSVVFGSTDGPIQQKPFELGEEPQVASPALPVITYPSISAATSVAPAVPVKAPVPVVSAPPPSLPATMAATSYYTFTPRPTSMHDYWPKQGAFNTYPVQYASPYMYAGLYSQQLPLPAYNPYFCPQPENLGSGHQWQQPCHGLTLDAPKTQVGEVAPVTEPSSSTPLPALPPHHSSVPSTLTQTAEEGADHAPPSAKESKSPSSPPSVPHTLQEIAHKAMLDLTTLSGVPATQLAEILRTNPALRDVVTTAIERHKLQGTLSSS